MADNGDAVNAGGGHLQQPFHFLMLLLVMLSLPKCAVQTAEGFDFRLRTGIRCKLKIHEVRRLYVKEKIGNVLITNSHLFTVQRLDAGHSIECGLKAANRSPATPGICFCTL